MQDSVSNFTLAPSLWPRQGYDLGNRAHVPTAGPTRGQIVARLPLPAPDPRTPARALNHGGIAVLPNASLCVVFAGVLSAVAPDGTLRWSLQLLEDSEPPAYHSAPVALASGLVVLTLVDSYIIVRADGTVQTQGSIPQADDSGCAPNLTPQGALVVTSPLGIVSLVQPPQTRIVGDMFGYDTVPPAVYPDGSLAIAGYYGPGFCRVDANGRVVWQTSFKQADVLPTVNSQEIAAVGSLNDKCARFFTPAGQQLGEYPRAAVFAVYNEDDWIASSRRAVARVASTGEVRWEQPLPIGSSLERAQPLVDAAGRIYAATRGSLVCLDGAGQMLFRIPTSSSRPLGLVLEPIRITPFGAFCQAGQMVIRIGS